MASAETNVGIRIGTGGSEEQVIKALDDIRLSILKLNEDTQKSCNAMLQTYKNYSENVIKVDLVKEARAESIRIKTEQTIKESQSRITNWEKTEAIKRTTFSEQNATKNININNKTAAEIKLIEEKQTQLIATENAKRIASAEKTASAIKLIKTKQAHEDLRLEQTRIAQTNGRADGGIGARFGNYMIGNAIGGIASSLPGGQILGPMAEMGFGLSGMAGAMGGTLAVVGALGAVAGACAIAVEGLHSFGSFLLNDIIKPQMKADTQYQQLANRSQGRIEAEELSQAAAKARVSHNITLEESNAGFEAFLKKGGEYKDMARALEVASISKQAYGGAVENKMNLLAELHQPNENMETTVRHFFAFEGLSHQPGFEGIDAGGALRPLMQVQHRLKGEDQFEQTMSLLALANKGGAKSPANAANAEAKFIQDAEAKLPRNYRSLQKGQTVVDMEALLRHELGATPFKQIKTDKMSTRDQAFIEQVREGGNYWQVYNDALERGTTAEQAKKEAIDAVIEAYNKNKEATETEKQAKEDAAKAAKTAGEKWDAAWNKIKDDLLKDDLMKEVNKFVNDITNNMGQYKQNINTAAEATLNLAKAINNLVAFINSINPWKAIKEGAEMINPNKPSLKKDIAYLEHLNEERAATIKNFRNQHTYSDDRAADNLQVEFDRDQKKIDEWKHTLNETEQRTPNLTYKVEGQEGFIGPPSPPNREKGSENQNGLPIAGEALSGMIHENKIVSTEQLKVNTKILEQSLKHTNILEEIRDHNKIPPSGPGNNPAPQPVLGTHPNPIGTH